MTIDQSTIDTSVVRNYGVTYDEFAENLRRWGGGKDDSGEGPS